MDQTVHREVTALPRLTMAQLRRRYAEVFGEATHVNNKAWLTKRLAWRLQALVEGDLSERARQRAAELANDADIRLSPPRMKPVSPPPKPRATRTPAPRASSHNSLRTGTVLARIYKGEAIHVKVLDHGFVFEGRVYSSL